MINPEECITAIEKRNQKVEADKAWETRWARRTLIAMITYFLAVMFMWSIDVTYPYLSALVPTGGFVLLTLTLSLLKKIRVKRYEEIKNA